MEKLFVENFYYFVMVFTVAYSLAFTCVLAGKFEYSRTARNFVLFLVCAVSWSVFDSLMALLFPHVADPRAFARISILFSPLYVCMLPAGFAMLVNVYNANVDSDRRFTRVKTVLRAAAAILGALFVISLFNPSFLYGNFGVYRRSPDLFRFGAGPGMVVFFGIVLVMIGIPALAVFRVSLTGKKSEALFVGIGALCALAITVATNVLRYFVNFQHVPRLGCLSMFVFCELTFYAIMRYGKILTVSRVFEERAKSRMIADSMESLVDIGNEEEILQRICDYTREASEAVIVCVISFNRADRTYEVRNISCGSPPVRENFCSVLPIVPGKQYETSLSAGVRRQMAGRNTIEFHSLREYFGRAENSENGTDRIVLLDIRRIISYPIVAEQEIWGALVLFREREHENTGLFRIFGIQCSLVLRFSSQIRELERMRRLEEEVYHSQKMEAIGQLAGGIAHDFNNMLSGISGYAQLIKRKFAAEMPELKMYADSMLSAAKNASDLTDKLLAFARKGKYQTVAIDLHETVQSVIELLEHTLDRKIRISQRFHARSSIIMGDPTQIQNLVLNLALNARNAMPAGGELTFKTEISRQKKGLSVDGKFEIKKGSFVVLSVIDTGVGMDGATRKRIFEPFFTTQDAGKGTGLGLASVYGTVKNHEGYIEVESEKNRGSTFSIYLPLAEMGISPEKTQKTEELIRGHGHILVVDDEEMIRRLSEEILTFMGYTVTTCGDGPEAIAYYREHADEVDVAIVDVMMQKMDGYETFRELKKIRPGVKVIIMTGYSLKEDTHQMMIKGVHGFLKKPFESGKLSRMLHEVITHGKTADAILD